MQRSVRQNLATPKGNSMKTTSYDMFIFKVQKVQMQHGKWKQLSIFLALFCRSFLNSCLHELIMFSVILDLGVDPDCLHCYMCTAIYGCLLAEEDQSYEHSHVASYRIHPIRFYYALHFCHTQNRNTYKHRYAMLN